MHPNTHKHANIIVFSVICSSNINHICNIMYDPTTYSQEWVPREQSNKGGGGGGRRGLSPSHSKEDFAYILYLKWCNLVHVMPYMCQTWNTSFQQELCLSPQVNHQMNCTQVVIDQWCKQILNKITRTHTAYY